MINTEKPIFDLSHVMGLKTPLWVFDIDQSRVVWANEAAVSLWHADSAQELYDRDMAADMSSTIEERLHQFQAEFIRTNRRFDECWTLYPNGKPHTYHVTFRGHLLPDGRMGMLCEATAEEQQPPERLRSAESLNHIPVSVSLFDAHNMPLYSNPAAHNAYGSSSLALAERFGDQEDLDQLLEKVKSSGSATHLCQVETRNGARWHEIFARSCHDALTGEQAVLLSEVDVTELKEQENKIRYLAHHDTLTGLQNRNFIHLVFPEKLAEASKTKTSLALILIDLDKFKIINDTLGHASGDRLLIHVATILKKLVGEKGIIARQGGDEFLILLPYCNIIELNTLCEQILLRIAEDCVVGEHRLNTNASIGIGLFPLHGRDLTTLMKHADLALYESKERGRNTYSYFRPALQKAALLQQEMEKDLCNALQQRQFRLFYQPRVDCKTHKVRSVEALMRWAHPEKGMIPPGMFINVLEETGLINEVGDWMVEKAGLDQRYMAAQGFDIPISINISPKQFERADFVQRLMRNLDSTGCPSRQIEIEITETMLMGEGYDSKATLMDLRDKGFSIAVDDFGTGYSNLAYIHEYPISVLKIDRSFIQKLEEQSPVISLVLSLCRLIGTQAVAEGVETVDQLSWLQQNHCNEFQGFLYSRPVPLKDLMALLRDPPHLAIDSESDIDQIPEVIWA